MSNIAVKFGNRLREIREAHNLSQESLSKKAGLDRTYVGKIERGQKYPTLRTINKIANALNVQVVALFKFDNTLKNG